MEKKGPIKISLPVFIAIIVLLVAIVYGIFMYMQNAKLEKEIANLREEITQSQSAKNELQEKLNSISNIASSNETKTDEESKEQESKSSSNLKLKYGEYYDSISSIKEVIENGGNDNVSGQARFDSNGKVFIADDVVRIFEGTYIISGDTVTCKLTTITNEGEKEKSCDYSVKYKILHNCALEVLSSDLKSDSDIYTIGDMLVCYR